MYRGEIDVLDLSTKLQEYIEELASQTRDTVQEKLGLDNDRRMHQFSGNDIKRMIELFDYKVEKGTESKIDYDKSTIYVVCEEGNNIEGAIEENREDVIHELGHVFLKDLFKDNNCKDDKNSGALTTKELAVEYFTRAFLLPPEEFTQVVISNSVNNVCNFVAVSEEFGVSKQAVIERGRNLLMWR